MDERQPDAGPGPETKEQQEAAELIAHPAKLIRIASMTRELLEQVRQSSLDEAGRKRLGEIYERSLTELREVLSEDLQRELDALAVPMDRTPSESEIRVAQAQLVGWLEGLFHGIQAALWASRMQSRDQLEEMGRRGLLGSAAGRPRAELDDKTSSGQYL